MLCNQELLTPVFIALEALIMQFFINLAQITINIVPTPCFPHEATQLMHTHGAVS